MFATEQSAGITNLKAVPTLPEELRASYNYDDLDTFMTKARLQPVPPTEDDGDDRDLRRFPDRVSAAAGRLIATAGAQ